MKLRAINIDDNHEYDDCYNTVVAILEVGKIQIPLCMNCVNDLIQDVEKFNNTIFCYKCKEFIMSKSGWRYGGSCKLNARNDNFELTEKDAGYNYCKDCMDTCKHAVLKD